MSIKSYMTYNNFKDAIISHRFRHKLMNFALNNIEYKQKKLILKSFPSFCDLNTTNVCNLKCKFCEIHYFHKKAKEISGKVFPNKLDIEMLKKHDSWLKYIVAMKLSSATGEPFANPNIVEIIHILSKHGIRLYADTNGLLIDEKTVKYLVQNKFRSLSFSIHAGNTETYKYLQGGDFNHLLSNLRKLVDIKDRNKSNYPLININFALNKENASTLKDIMHISSDIGVDTFTLYHYYDSRNILNKNVTFYSDVEQCNKLLGDAYDYAKKLNLNVTPVKPAYLTNGSENAPTLQTKSHCNAPWTSIKFKGCVEFENSEYIGVCNRILLFRIDFKKFYGNHTNTFRTIWNHELLQYFRKSVNSNPICKFCKDPDTPIVRCLNNVEYSHRRDKATKDFFAEFRNSYDFNEIDGLTILDENPYKYEEKDGF